MQTLCSPTLELARLSRWQTSNMLKVWANVCVSETTDFSLSEFYILQGCSSKPRCAEWPSVMLQEVYKDILSNTAPASYWGTLQPTQWTWLCEAQGLPFSECDHVLRTLHLADFSAPCTLDEHLSVNCEQVKSVGWALCDLWTKDLLMETSCYLENSHLFLEAPQILLLHLGWSAFSVTRSINLNLRCEEIVSERLVESSYTVTIWGGRLEPPYSTPYKPITLTNQVMCPNM